RTCFMRASSDMSIPSENFEQAGSTHTATDTHGDHHVAHATAAAFQEGVPYQSRAGHAEGMTNRDGTAIDVQAIIGNAQPVTAIEHLTSEGFVDFPQTDIVHTQTVLLQQLGN